MSNYFILTLDTTGPANPTISLEGGATYATSQLINAAIGTSDESTAGYQMKVWGSVDTNYDSNVQTTKTASNWIAYSPNKQIMLSDGEGNKSIHLVIRDDVHNESSQASASINLVLTLPVATIQGPDVGTISKIEGVNVASFSFQSDTDFTEYKVKVVSSASAAHDTGTQIPTVAGSTNLQGTGDWTEGQIINSSITGQDLEAASAGDGDKIVKVFVKDAAGQWSV